MLVDRQIAFNPYFSISIEEISLDIASSFGLENFAVVNS